MYIPPAALAPHKRRLSHAVRTHTYRRTHDVVRRNMGGFGHMVDLPYSLRLKSRDMKLITHRGNTSQRMCAVCARSRSVGP